MKSVKVIIAAFYGLLVVNQTTLQAQQKKYLTRENYKEWSDFGASDLSADGKWVYYNILHQEADTLFLVDKTKSKTHSFTGAYNASFSPNSKWFGFIRKDSLHLVNLATGKHHLLGVEVLEYSFSFNGSYAIAIEQTNETKSLKILDLKTLKAKSITNVIEYKFSPDNTKIAIHAKLAGLNKVSVYTLNAIISEKVIVTDSDSKFKELQWDDSSIKLAFFKEMREPDLSYKNHIVYWCNTEAENFILKELHPKTNATFPKNSYIPISKLYVSAKSNQVFFDYKQIANENATSKNKEAVQIWLSEDQTIPPADKNEEDNNATTWISWETNEQKVNTVEEEEHKNAVLSGNDDNVLLYNFKELTPFYKYGGEYITIYIKNLKTGVKTLLSSKQTRIENQVVVSPAGKYVAYFKDNNWWTYNIKLQEHKCITIGMPSAVHRLDYDRPNLIPPYGSPGWTKNDENMIMYDQFDIWLMKPDGTSRKRITNGKPTGTTYRVHENRSKPAPRYTFFGFQTQVIDFNKMVLLKTQSSTTLGEGVATYHNGIIKQLFKKESRVHVIAKTKSESEFLFLESNFTLPPRLFSVNSHGIETEIKQSNPQQKEFYWGNSKLITYKNKDGKKLSGALFYPAKYDATKKYPMLVCIYEKKAQEVLEYNNPSSYSDHGFNNTNYTSEGYFVLYPDIAFGINTTGDDATDCVKATVEEAVKTATINKNAIALIGHSFGGFETAYIMGHSNIFKTAIIGAPMIDLVSAYLTTDGHGMSNMWRFEFDQFRMLATFDNEIFDINSPLKSAKNINAPVLIWTGTDDKQLDWKHSMKLQSALWRLGKKSTLLVYPNEGHIITKKNNQFDLMLKCKEWLDFYLKDQPKQDWMGKQ